MKKPKSVTYTNLSTNWSSTISTNTIATNDINNTIPTSIWEDAHKKNLSAKDVILDGKSLSEVLEKIEQRLAILHPSEELEDRWSELKELGEQYRKLEQEILEKEKTWNIIKNG